jgi:hypothetical protein
MLFFAKINLSPWVSIAASCSSFSQMSPPHLPPQMVTSSKPYFLMVFIGEISFGYKHLEGTTVFVSYYSTFGR